MLLIRVAGKVNSLIYQPVNCFRAIFHHQAHGIFMAQTCAGDQCIGNVGVRAVIFIEHCGNATLGQPRGASLHGSFADKGNLQIFVELQCQGQAGDTTANN